MTYRENLKVLAFVGLTETGREAATNYFAERGHPRVGGNDLHQQVQDLDDAGQHRLVLDDALTDDDYKLLRHKFPGELIAIAPTIDPVAGSTLESFHEELQKLADEAGF